HAPLSYPFTSRESSNSGPATPESCDWLNGKFPDLLRELICAATSASRTQLSDNMGLKSLLFCFKAFSVRSERSRGHSEVALQICVNQSVAGIGFEPITFRLLVDERPLRGKIGR